MLVAGRDWSSMNFMNNVAGRSLNPESRSKELAYADPYDWDSMLAHLRAHHLPHIETVDATGYERVVETSLGLGWLRVTPGTKRNTLLLRVYNGGEADLSPISSTVEKLFDLRARPEILREAMSADPYLANVWSKRPGLRVARAWDAFESILTTTLGQLVSVSFGRMLTRELMDAAGSKVAHPKTGEMIRLFPTARQILSADLSSVRTSQARRLTIHALASLTAEGMVDWSSPLSSLALRKTLRSVPGIGAWTSEYTAMRGFNDDDAFPSTDYVLKQVLRAHPELDVARVRPWRAYAAAALWKHFAASKGRSSESGI
jgi:DNA-3-methyladenine glycosylase II